MHSGGQPASKFSRPYTSSMTDVWKNWLTSTSLDSIDLCACEHVHGRADGQAGGQQKLDRRVCMHACTRACADAGTDTRASNQTHAGKARTRGRTRKGHKRTIACGERPCVRYAHTNVAAGHGRSRACPGLRARRACACAPAEGACGAFLAMAASAEPEGERRLCGLCSTDWGYAQRTGVMLNGLGLCSADCGHAQRTVVMLNGLGLCSTDCWSYAQRTTGVMLNGLSLCSTDRSDGQR